MSSSKTLLLSFILISAAQLIVAQDTPHPGIELYRQGKYAEAVTSLTFAVNSNAYGKNAEIWRFLGLAQSRSGEGAAARRSLEKAAKLSSKSAPIQLELAYVYLQIGEQAKARSAAEKAITLDPANAEAYHLRGVLRLRNDRVVDAGKDAAKVMELDPTAAGGYVLAAQVEFERFAQSGDISPGKGGLKFIENAVSILRIGREKCHGTDSCKRIADEAEAIEIYREYFVRDDDERLVPDNDPAVTPLKIVSKPKASYTDSARREGKQGTIRVLVLFRSDGRIGRPLLMNRLGYGLDENVLNAAFKITFEPKRVDGKPVSVVRQIQYSFEIY